MVDSAVLFVIAIYESMSNEPGHLEIFLSAISLLEHDVFTIVLRDYGGA